MYDDLLTIIRGIEVNLLRSKIYRQSLTDYAESLYNWQEE